MKLVKIFGMVLALHIVLLTVFFLSPGCRSTPSTPVEVAPEEVTQPAPSENWTNQPSSGYAQSSASSSALSPVPIGRGSSYSSTAPLTSLTPAERARSAPSRPANPGDFINPSTNSATPTTSAGYQPQVTAGGVGQPVQYTVRAGDSLWRISREHGTTVGEIAAANPGIKADALQPGDVINIPASALAPTTPSVAGTASAPAAVTSAAANSTYTVRPGDSLSKIAARNGTTVASLRTINNLTSDVIQIGQVLVVPGGEAGPAPGPAREAIPSDAVTVTVQRGDTLGGIARKFDVSVRQLMQVNNITDPTRVPAGKVLVIPGYEPVGTGQIPTTQRAFTAPAPAPSTTSPAAAPETQAALQQPPAQESASSDLDDLIPPDVLDAPVVPIDEPVPQP